MKKATKILLIIAGSCILVGSGLMISMGILGDMFYAGHSMDLGPDGFRIGDFSGMTPTQGMSQGEHIVLAGAELRELEIELNAVEVNVLRDGSVEEIVLVDVSDEVKYDKKVNNGKLNLTIERDDKLVHIGNSGKAYATILIPEDLEFAESEIDANASSLWVKNLTSGAMVLELNASSVTMEEMQINILEVENNASALELYGDVGIRMDVECNAGSIEMDLNGVYEDFSYQINSAAGSTEIGEQDFSSLKSKTVMRHENAQKTADIECNMGSIKIQFVEEL